MANTLTRAMQTLDLSSYSEKTGTVPNGAVAPSSPMPRTAVPPTLAANVNRTSASAISQSAKTVQQLNSLAAQFAYYVRTHP